MRENHKESHATQNRRVERFAECKEEKGDGGWKVWVATTHRVEAKGGKAVLLFSRIEATEHRVRERSSQVKCTREATTNGSKREKVSTFVNDAKTQGKTHTGESTTHKVEEKGRGI